MRRQRLDKEIGSRPKSVIRVEGIVQDALPNAVFRVALSDGHEVLAHASQALRLRVVRILPGQRVTVEIASHDPSRGRIIFQRRLSNR